MSTCVHRGTHSSGCFSIGALGRYRSLDVAATGVHERCHAAARCLFVEGVVVEPLVMVEDGEVAGVLSTGERIHDRFEEGVAVVARGWPTSARVRCGAVAG